MQPILEKTTLSASDEKKLKEKITATFYDFFLNYESLEELGDPKAYMAKLAEIKAFGEDLLGEDKIPDINELWDACSSATKNCNHEGCKGSSS